MKTRASGVEAGLGPLLSQFFVALAPPSERHHLLVELGILVAAVRPVAGDAVLLDDKFAEEEADRRVVGVERPHDTASDGFRL